MVLCLFNAVNVSAQNYPIVDTDVSDYYNASAIISPTASGDAFHGQDASYTGNQPSYTDNGDGTITDNVTGLMWEQDMGIKISYDDAFIKATNSTLGGHSDWRVPTIKELYSLAVFTGRCNGDYVIDKFIDTNYFTQPIGSTAIGEREIDAQTWSSNEYTGLTMGGDATVFGYNFVDGRLKGYPKFDPQSGNAATMYFRLVRGNTSYGINDFVDNGDGTISDNATGLMWQQTDDGTPKNWETSLSYSENLVLGGFSDWRMPNAKELQSIVDYNRSPTFTNSPAIDALFSCTSFNNPEGNSNYGYYWTSSPLMDGPSPYTDAVYVCFGEAQGQMESPPGSGNLSIMDTHGAGASRNDPKEEASGTTYPTYWGPQGDVVYVYNYIRCVRDISPNSIEDNDSFEFNVYPNPASETVAINANSRIVSITLYNSIGENVSLNKVNSKTANIDVSSLATGIYIVKVTFVNGEIVSERIAID